VLIQLERVCNANQGSHSIRQIEPSAILYQLQDHNAQMGVSVMVLSVYLVHLRVRRVLGLRQMIVLFVSLGTSCLMAVASVPMKMEYVKGLLVWLQIITRANVMVSSVFYCSDSLLNSS